jgi:hypothetical protein
MIAKSAPRMVRADGRKLNKYAALPK